MIVVADGRSASAQGVAPPAGVVPSAGSGAEVDAAAADPSRADASEGNAAVEPVDPNAPTVGASLDRTDAHVGDRLTLTVSAVARDAVFASIRLPKIELGKFEVLDSSSTDLDLGDGKKSKRFVLQIAAYEVGDLEIPQITVEYRGSSGETKTVPTSAIPVRVGKLVEDPAAELEPLQKTRGLLIDDRRWVQGFVAAGVGLGVLLVLLILRSILRRRRVRARIVVPEVKRPAHEIALERLAALRAGGGIDADAYRPFHFELSDVLRAYLGGRFGFETLELTTTELLAELEPRTRSIVAPTPPSPSSAVIAPAAATAAEATPQATSSAPAELDPRQHALIAALLEECDLVKFAKAPSDDASAMRLLDAAEAIVRATMHSAQPVIPAAAVAG